MSSASVMWEGIFMAKQYHAILSGGVRPESELSVENYQLVLERVESNF
jgi:hypothetical protein